MAIAIVGNQDYQQLEDQEHIGGNHVCQNWVRMSIETSVCIWFMIYTLCKSKCHNEIYLHYV
jgi:hypothetical protein